MNNIKFEINQNIATITFDLENEKVNKLSFEVLKEFDEKLTYGLEMSPIHEVLIDKALLGWKPVCSDLDSLIRDAARADPGTACCRFGMTLAQLKAISDLPPDGVMAIVNGRTTNAA